MRRRVLALGLAVAVAGAGCSSSGHHAAASTTTVQSTRAAPNPDVIPPVITSAYVNAVFAVLNHIYGDATRQLATDRSVTPRVQEDLRAIFNDPVYGQQLQAASESLSGAINNVRPNPGDGVTTVKQLIAATSDCIFVETATDLNDVLVHPTPEAASEYYSLEPKQAGDDPNHINQTPWAIAYNSAYLTPTSVPDKCSE